MNQESVCDALQRVIFICDLGRLKSFKRFKSKWIVIFYQMNNFIIYIIHFQTSWQPVYSNQNQLIVFGVSTHNFYISIQIKMIKFLLIYARGQRRLYVYLIINILCTNNTIIDVQPF